MVSETFNVLVRVGILVLEADVDARQRRRPIKYPRQQSTKVEKIYRRSELSKTSTIIELGSLETKLGGFKIIIPATMIQNPNSFCETRAMGQNYQ